MRLIATAMMLWPGALFAGDTESASADGWRSLFDGGDLSAWRTYRSDVVSSGWQVVDGTLQRAGPAGDLITRDEFENFELELEWRVAPGGNSGVFFRADESQPQIYMSAPEVQILDDAGHRDGASELTSAGSNYALHAAPRGVVRPAGEWNRLRLKVEGATVSQWLNGVHMITYELGSADWQARVAASKFSQWPVYGTLPRGHIGLQDHGDVVAFRNIRVRELP